MIYLWLASDQVEIHRVQPSAYPQSHEKPGTEHANHIESILTESKPVSTVRVEARLCQEVSVIVSPVGNTHICMTHVE